MDIFLLLFLLALFHDLLQSGRRVGIYRAPAATMGITLGVVLVRFD